MAVSASIQRESDEARRPGIGRALVAAHLQILAGAAALAGAGAAWRFLGEKANVMHGAWVAAGLVGTVAFGWAMGHLETVAPASAGWMIRWPVELYKRVLLAGELAAAAVALMGAARLALLAAGPCMKFFGSLFHG